MNIHNNRDSKIDSKIDSNIPMKSHKIRVLELIKEEKVVTTSEIALFLKVSWNTAEKCLLELALDGELLRLKKAGVNLWLIK